jgi:hypothetical protein
VLAELKQYMSDEAVADFYPELMGARMVDGKVLALPLGAGRWRCTSVHEAGGGVVELAAQPV